MPPCSTPYHGPDGSPSRVGRGRAVAAALWCAAALLPVGAVRADDRPTRVLHAHSLGGETITLDGKLDEPAWQAAEVGGDFVERGPVPGAKPPVTTTVRVVFDRDAVYVGIRCELEPGDTPRALTLNRDKTQIWSDEALTIKFDVRHDRRSTVGFALNPEAAQIDFVAIDNGRQFRVEYDAIWEAATDVQPGYWTAEVRLPVAALGLPAMSGPRILGFNVSRGHNARIADYDWSHLPPEFGPWSAIHYGQLHGLRDMAGGMPFSLRPYSLASYGGHNRVANNDPQTGLGGKLGGGVSLRVGDDIWTELTVLTDFAQVDVDDQVLNLNRFELFVPERRPFFLSGLSVFDFGEPAVVQPFFTRRIGRNVDGEVPILVGTKIYGSAGRFEFGLLDVVTDDTTEAAEDPADNRGAPGQNWAVARARYNFASPGHVGVLAATLNQIDVLVTDPEVPAAKEPHVTLGIDQLIRGADNRLEFTSFGSMTITDALDEKGRRVDERGRAGQAKLRWLGSMWVPEISARWVDEDFDPKLGFVRQTDALTSTAKIALVQRTSRLGLSSVRVRQEAVLIHDQRVKRLLERKLGTTTEVRWANGWGVDVGLYHDVDVPQADFELDLGQDVTVLASRYEGPRFTSKVSSPSRRNPSGSLGYTYSAAFFSGSRHAINASGTVYANKHLRLGAGADLQLLQLSDCRDATDADGETFVECGGDGPMGPTRLIDDEQLSVNGKITLTPTTTLTTDLTLQINTQTETAFAQLRTRYRYMPGSDVFIVYQEQIGYAERPTRARRYSAVLKVAHRYDSVL